MRRSGKGKRSAVTTSEIAPVDVAAVLDDKRTVQKSECSRTVAVLVPNLGSPHHVMAFRGINAVLVALGYEILFHNVGREDQEDPATLASLQMDRPAGYIIIQGGEGRNAEHARAILQQGVPLVSLGSLAGVETHAVAVDDRLAASIATDYVIELGHRRLGYFAGPSFFGCAKQRQQGFVESLINHGIPVSDALILKSETHLSAREAYLAALEALKDPKTRPTALLCFNDMLAVEVYRAARELSLEIPRDLSVVGVDNIDPAAMLAPPLTTIDIFPELSGRQAAELLVKAMRNELDNKVVFQRIEPKLVVRGSVRSI